MLRAPSVRAGLAQRARIVLLAADGVPVKEIVERVGASKPTVIGWKKRYAAEGVGGLEDRGGLAGRLWSTRFRSCWPHWSRRRSGSGVRTDRLPAGRELGISHVWVSKIWRQCCR